MAWTGFIGLGLIDENGAFNEVDVPGYARSRFDFSRTINGRMQGAGNWIRWYGVPNDPALYNAFGFFADETGGTAVAVYPEPTAHTMGDSNFASMNPYQVVINVVDSATGSGHAIDGRHIVALLSDQNDPEIPVANPEDVEEIDDQVHQA